MGFCKELFYEIKNNTWNIRRLVAKSFVPSAQGTSVLYCRLTDFYWYLDFTELENFGTRIFRHMDVSVLGNFGIMQSSTDVSAHTFWHLCRNVLLCRNVHFSKVFMCLNVAMPKNLVPESSCAECKMSWTWNVRAEMSLAKMSGSEITQAGV